MGTGSEDMQGYSGRSSSGMSKRIRQHFESSANSAYASASSGAKPLFPGWKSYLLGGAGVVCDGGGGGVGGGGGGGGSPLSTSTSTSQPPNVSTTPVTIPVPPKSSSHLDDVMEALKDPRICKVGICYNHDAEIIASEDVERIKRRSERDNLFCLIVMVTVNKNPNLREIQHQIADKLGICLDDEAGNVKEGHKMRKIWDWGGKKKEAVIISENAKKISEAIHNNQQQQRNILFILSNLHERLDLEILGIPFGVPHTGCKVIFTSESEELLSNQMNSQLTYML